MTVYLNIFSPGQRIDDDNGDPVASGTLEFYDAGTSTPRTVYSDKTLSTSLGTTVSLNSAGYPVTSGNARTLVYPGLTAFKVIAKDSSGSTLWTHDNVLCAVEIATASETSLPETPVVSKTAAYSIVDADQGKVINANATGGSFVLTLPSAVTVGDGWRVAVRHTGTSNVVTIRTTSSQTIDIPGKQVTSFALKGRGQSVWLVSDGANWHEDGSTPALMQDGLPFVKITDRLTAPPTSPTGGNRYIANGTPTGAWATLSFSENQIIEADGNGSWFAYTPTAGYLAFIADEELFSYFDGTEWTDMSNVTAPQTSVLKTARYELQYSNGTGGGTPTANAFTNDALDKWVEVSNTTSSVTMATGVWTFAAGTYMVLYTRGFYNCNDFQARFKSTTTSTAITSPSGYTNNGALITGTAVAAGFLTLSASEAFSPQYLAGFAAANGLGLATSASSDTERYGAIEIIDLTSIQGPQGEQGTQGADGLDASFDYQWSTATSGDPGSGKVRGNNATVASITELGINKLTNSGADIEAEIATWDDSTSSIRAKVYIVKEGAAGNRHSFSISGAGTDQGDYWTFPVTYVGTAGTISNGNDVAVNVIRTGDKGDAGSNGTSGADGATGAAGVYSFDWTFDTGTTDADPGSGKVRANHATLSSATALYINETDRLGVSQAAAIAQWDDSTNTVRGYITLVDLATPANKVRFSISGTNTDNGSYDTINVAYVSGVTSLTAVNVAVLVERNGDKGSDGAGSGDVVGPSASVDGELALFDGTTGKLLERGVPVASVINSWTYDTSTTMADPGTGDFRLNTSSIITATAIAFSDLSADPGNPDLSTLVQSWDNSTNVYPRGYLLMRAGTTWIEWIITGAVTDNTGWTQIPIAVSDSSGSLPAAGTAFTFRFSRTGFTRFTNTSLKIEDTDASHVLTIAPGSNLSANRTLTVTTGDADRTLTISGSATVSQDYSSTGSPTFANPVVTTIELGHASDTTLARSGAGDVTIEGNAIYRAGGTDVPVTDGGTGASTASAARTNLGLGYAVGVIGTVRNVGGAVGDGATDDRGAIATADAAGDVVFPRGTYKISSNITISNACTFLPGAKLSIDSAVIVTFTKPVTAGIEQIFSGSGTVSFTRSQNVHPEWWGAVADNSTACRAAIQAANDALPLGSCIILQQGSYRLDTTTITLTNASIVGCGRQSILRPNASASTAVVTVAYPRVSLQNFSIFGDHLSSPVNTGIQLGTASVEVGTSVVDDIWIYGFNGSGGTGIRCYRGNAVHFHRLRIQQCYYGVYRGGARETNTVTITIASPGVITMTGHTLQNSDIVVLTTTGALPTGYTAGTSYYVVNAATNTFQLSATAGGAAINTSGSQSGTHTATSGKYWGDCHWDDAVIQATAVGVLDDNGCNAQYQRDMSILGCNVGYQATSSVAESGVWIRPANIWFWHSNISANTAAGVYLTDGYLFEFGDTDINGTISGPNVLIDGTAASDIEGIAFYDGSISGSQGHGVNLNSGRNVRFVGVKIVANSGNTPNLYDGIIVGAAWQGLFEVLDCLIGVSANGESGWGNAYQWQQYGINIHASACTDAAASGGVLAAVGRVHIAGNMLAGNASGAINGTGAPTGAFSRIYNNVGVSSQTEGIATTFSNAITASSTIELGHASDTTLARSSAGNVSIEGNVIYRAGGTDVALADGGTGASLADPNADRIMFWDDSGGAVDWLTVGSGLTISGTTISATGGGSGDVTAAAVITDNRIVRGDGGAKGVQESLVTIDDSGNMTGVVGLTVGHTTNLATVNGAGTVTTPVKQVHGTGGAGSSASQTRWSNAAGGPFFVLNKSRGTTVGDYTVVQSGDTLGEIVFAGADGTDMEPGATIRAEVNGTPGAGDMPTKVVIATTSDGAEAVTDRVTIDSTGLSIGTSAALTAGTIELGAASDTTISRSSAGVIAVEGVTVALNSTSVAHTAGTIELGAASDTTLSRASAGQLAVEGVNVLMNGGALGTPSSGTLTNCTGLPVAGITASTSTALGVGSIELGHASDTTLARSAAGVVTIEGNVIKTAGKETIWLPATSFVAKATSGAGSTTYDSGSNDVTVTAWGFDTTTQEYIHSIPIGMPKSWNESTVTAIVYWTNAGGASTETVRWTVAGMAISDDDTINTTFGTAVNIDDTWLAQNDLHIAAESSAITIGGTPAENDMIVLQVSRDVANDNMAGDAVFLGMKLMITTNAANDA